MAKRILVVDDNEDLLALLSDALGDAGYDVVTCSRSREAYQLAKAWQPDVALLDILMPAMNGWEVLNIFLLDRDLRKVPVVLMTAGATDARRRLAGLEEHDITILPKPFNIERLLDVLQQALGQPQECEDLYDQITEGAALPPKEKVAPLLTPVPRSGDAPR